MTGAPKLDYSTPATERANRPPSKRPSRPWRGAHLNILRFSFAAAAFFIGSFAAMIYGNPSDAVVLLVPGLLCVWEVRKLKRLLSKLNREADLGG